MSEITINQLTCGYPARRVLEGLSFAVRPGEVTVLSGPNGCGKTTLLRALARLLRPERGGVLIDGDDLWRLSPQAAARRIAFTPQFERRDWPLTVEHCVLLGRSPVRGYFRPFTAEDHAIVESALASTGTDALRHRDITTLSGGQWRRMILARALAQEADVLLLDEPTSGLDLKYQVEILDIVARLAGEGRVVVFALHDLHQAARVADRLLLMRDGEIVVDGPPREVITPEAIAAIFGLEVSVVEHPCDGSPLVVPRPRTRSTETTATPTAIGKSAR